MARELNQNLKNDLIGFRNLFFAQIKRKVIWTILLYLLFIYLYGFTQYHIHFPVIALSQSKLDLLIGFDQRWAVVYLTLFIMIGFGSLTLSNAKDFFNFILLYCCIFFTAIAIFYFFPTSVERPEINKKNFLYNLILEFDLSTNCFPSLHASFCIISMHTFYKNTKELMYRNFYCLLMLLWVLLIFFAILKIKQHYLIDLLGGILNSILWIWLIDKILKRFFYREKIDIE